MNLADCVRDSARRAPDAVALAHSPGTGGGRATVTWGALDADVDAVAAGLRADLHLRPGDRVALMLANSPQLVAAYFGVLRAGLVAVPVNPAYTAVEVSDLLGESGASVVVCAEPVLHVVEEAVASTNRAVVGPAGFQALVSGGRAAGQVEPTTGDEDLAALLFTSGTSGRPRGAMLSHRALLANLRQCSALDPAPMTAEDVVLLALPLFHVYGLNAVLGMVAATGASAVLVERFDPRATLHLIASERVTHVAGAPAMYDAWASLGGQGDLSATGDSVDLAACFATVRVLVSGSAPLPPALLERMRTRAGVTVREGYGLTEAAPVVTSTLASVRVKPGSAGRPLPGIELRIVDDDGRPVGADDDADTGEIEVRGDNLFSGYWPDGSDGPTADGWWATGDIGYLDDEGDLYLVDRRKELVLVNGFNVYPREVEDALSEHPGVAEVAVVAVPDPQTGEAVKAYVVARPGSGLRAADVTEHCSTRLARFKRPTIVELVDRLPHSTTGKVAKGRLREGSRR